MPADLTAPSQLLELLRRHGIRPRQRLGQNFLVDRHVLDRIVQAAELGPDDWVLEIGAGVGTLTRELAARAGRTVAVEADPRLIPALEETLSPYGVRELAPALIGGLPPPSALGSGSKLPGMKAAALRLRSGQASRTHSKLVEIVTGDIMELDLDSLLSGVGRGFHAPPSPHPESRSPQPAAWKVVANLPYYLTSPLIARLIAHRDKISLMILMVQVEVADRLLAAPGGKQYGSLSVFVQAYTEPKLVAKVPRRCFFPAPQVDSALLRLQVARPPRVPPELEEPFSRVARAAFAQRRKTLPNTLAAGLGISRQQALDLLERAGIAPGRRGETLSLEEFLTLAGALTVGQGILSPPSGGLRKVRPTGGRTGG